MFALVSPQPFDLRTVIRHVAHSIDRLDDAWEWHVFGGAKHSRAGLFVSLSLLNNIQSELITACFPSHFAPALVVMVAKIYPGSNKTLSPSVARTTVTV